MKHASVRQALARVVSEARNAEVVEPAWPALESKLTQCIAGERPAPPRAPRASVRGSIWGLGIAASAAAALLLARPATAPEPRAPAPAVSGAIDGDRLPLGKLVEALSRGVSVEHADRAVWKLQPQSRARLVARGGTIEISLEAGALSADVLPEERSETFVVVAGGARVAVRGTAFSVERQGASTRVHVTRGVVAVHPERRDGPPTIVRAPEARRFDSRGLPMRRPDDGLVAPSPPDAKPRATPRLPPRSVAPPAPLNEEPTVDELELGIDAVNEVVRSCLLTHTNPSGSFDLAVQSMLVISILPDGSIGEHAFEPPLHPDVEACSDRALGSIRFAASRRGLRVARRLELSR